MDALEHDHKRLQQVLAAWISTVDTRVHARLQPHNIQLMTEPGAQMQENRTLQLEKQQLTTRLDTLEEVPSTAVCVCLAAWPSANLGVHTYEQLSVCLHVPFANAGQATTAVADHHRLAARSCQSFLL